MNFEPKQVKYPVLGSSKIVTARQAWGGQCDYEVRGPRDVRAARADGKTRINDRSSNVSM